MNYKNIIDNYFDEKELKLIIYEDKIYIDNYKELNNFDSSKIVISGENKIIEINGDDLIISRLLNKELLITGKILEMGFKKNGK
ncbi:MAG: YabP/YqfC family sporulation protein [Bacilli bacterium]